MHGRVYLVFTSIALLTLHAGAQGPYYLQRALSGSSFFDAFTFDDPSTDERVSSDRLVNASSARAAGLASVADDGHVLLRVDNSTSVAYNDKRASVSVTSADAWGLGTLVVLDVRHVRRPLCAPSVLSNPRLTGASGRTCETARARNADAVRSAASGRRSLRVQTPGPSGGAPRPSLSRNAHADSAMAQRPEHLQVAQPRADEHHGPSCWAQRTKR